MNRLRKNESCKTTALLFYITQLYVAVILTGLPLVAGMGGYVTTEEDTFLFFTATSVVYLGTLCLGMVELILTGTDHFPPIFDPLKQLSRTRACFLVYLVWSGLSAVQSPHKGVWFGLGRHEGLCEILL